MPLPQIRLQTQSAQIEMQQQLGKHYIRQQHADISIEQPKAQLSMQTRPAKLTIDQTQAWADMNLVPIKRRIAQAAQKGIQARSEEHTSELQSRGHLVCRLLLEKKKK